MFAVFSFLAQITCKAARFLIANIPAHRTYVGKEIDSLKQMKKESIQQGRICDEIVTHWKSFDYSSSQVVKDIDVIKADILIENTFREMETNIL